MTFDAGESYLCFYFLYNILALFISITTSTYFASFSSPPRYCPSCQRGPPLNSATEPRDLLLDLIGNVHHDCKLRLCAVRVNIKKQTPLFVGSLQLSFEVLIPIVKSTSRDRYRRHRLRQNSLNGHRAETPQPCRNRAWDHITTEPQT